MKVRVLVDGKEVSPGEISFCDRSQDLTAIFGGILVECRDSNGDGIISAAECLFENEELSLVLKTMSANAFNFILGNIAQGIHHIQIQARIDSSSSMQNGSAQALASIGKASLLVQEVRAVKGDQFEF